MAHQISTSLLFGDERMNEILKFFSVQISGIPIYDQFKEDVKVTMQRRDKDKIIEETKTKLKTLLNTLDNELKKIAKSISEIIAPNTMVKTSINTEGIIAELQYSTALDVARWRPDHIHKILQLAFEQKRFEFFFTTVDYILNDPDAPVGYKNKVRNVYETVEKQLGLVELRATKKQAETNLVEVKTYLELITVSPDEFEAKVRQSILTAKTMFKAGQLEGERILVK